MAAIDAKETLARDCYGIRHAHERLEKQSRRQMDIYCSYSSGE